MVQATDFANWHHLSQLRWLDRLSVRRILGEGEVAFSRSSAAIVSRSKS